MIMSCFRWLVLKGRKEDAFIVLTKITTLRNVTHVSSSNWERQCVTECKDAPNEVNSSHLLLQWDFMRRLLISATYFNNVVNVIILHFSDFL